MIPPMTPADVAPPFRSPEPDDCRNESTGWVDRCVCHDITFARLLGEIPCADTSPEAALAAVEAAAQRFGCGRTCGMCRPYLALAFARQTPRIPIGE